MIILKQSTAVTLKIGPFLDETDGKTAETGLAIAQADVRLSKNGGDIAQKNEATSCTHDELGIYGCPIDATDTGSLGRLQLWVHESGALPVWHDFMIVTANIYDSMFSTDKLEVDVNQLGGGAQSATDMKDFADSGYDPSTHRTQAEIKTINSGVITADAIAADAIGASEFAQAAADKVWATAARALTDKAGFTLSTAGITAIWEKNISAFSGAGYAGTYLKMLYDDWLNGGRLDLILDAIKTETDTHPTLAEIEASSVLALKSQLITQGSNDFNATAKASINTEVDTGLSDIKLDHLIAVADADDPVNDSIISKMAASDGDWSGFDKATDALEAIRDRGDAAWITGGGGGITDIIQAVPSIPTNIDLANTKTIRLALYLINSLDDLPSTAEITPGTITIDHSADGGTSWSTIVNAAACTEQAGQIYYDEVFDSSSGYASGDMIRITFKGQKITVAANDYEITGAGNGWMFHTRIDGGAAGDSAAAVADAVWDEAIADHVSGTSFGAKNQKVVPSETIGDYKANISTLALEATLTAIKGAGWTNETLKVISEYVDALETRLTATRAGYLDNLSAGAVALASICTETRLAELAAANLPADIDSILADTGTDGVLLAATASSAALVDAIWDELLTGATHNIATSAGRRLRELAAYAIESGTAQAGGATTITLAADANGGDGVFNRNLIVLVGGTGSGQTRTIADYNNTSKVCIIDREWRINPDATSEYQIVADDTPLVVDHGVAQGGTSTTITLRDYASSINDTYLCNIIIIIGGTGRGQARLVGSYNGSTKVATICGDNWVTIPDTTSVYAMVPYGTTCTSCVGTSGLSQITDDVWDELQSEHTDAGSFGKYLDATISGVGGAVGSGALSCTWTQKDDGDQPMDNIQVWITTDEEGTNVIAGTLLTNANGEVTFMLDAGTYYVWREKGGYNFTNPQTWTVS